MKFLILSCNTGQGHNSAANALCEKFISMGHECVVKDTLRYCSKVVSKSISKSYDKIVLHTPKAFGVGYRFSKSIVYKGGKRKSAVYAVNMTYSKRIYRDVVQNNYDAIICCHVFPAQAMTHIRHKYNLQKPVFVVATDYSFSPFYDELDVDRFFVSLPEVKHEYTERGIPEEKIITSGIPISERFVSDITKSQARTKLALSQNKFLCLIMSGSMGFGNIFTLIDEMLKKPLPNYEILVIAGNNNKLRRSINETYSKYDNVAAIGFTDKVHLYMRASDMVITKPGGLSTTEAMVSNVPLVLVNPIPGCETENYNCLTGLGVALEGNSIDDAILAFESLVIDNVISEQTIRNQKKYINRNSSGDICNYIINYVKK
ncbi:MAG: glycosyltransferase [Ruminococcaceae bacterium]|nr:glycosyltransferase [Oscillospiraceae bacterium]